MLASPETVLQGWRPASIISGAPPSGFLGEFRSYYGPTMNAFAAAEGSDRADKLQAELEALFDSQNTSASLAVTRIPANFLRVTVVRE